MSNGLTIVHELNQLDYGGVEKVIRGIIKYDQKNQHTVLAYQDGKFKSRLEEVGAKIILAPKESNDDIDLDADIIHIHSGGGISEMAISLAGAFPIIETIHSPIRSPMVDRYIHQRVGVTEAVSKMNKNCMTIQNGVDFDELNDIDLSRGISRESIGIPNDALVIGRLGRVGADKGLEEFLLTCYYLQQKGHQFWVLIIGDEARTANGFRGRMKLMAASLPVKNVIWLDNQPLISEYLSMIDIFLYPSLTEGFGLTIIEAMYNNCTVVSYENEVNKEIVPGYALLVKESEGILGLVNATEKLIVNEVFRSAYSGLGREWIKAKFNAHRMSLDYQELYERCYFNFNRKNKPQTEQLVPA